MKTLWKTLIVLLALALVFSLTSAVFAADDAEEVPAEETEAAEPVEEAAAEDAEEPSAEDAEDPAEEAAPDEGGMLLCAAGETMSVSEGDVICAEGGTVFNNGATVYNNGGTVYNNRGVCYNNAGVCYNNEGTVYLNGGRAFNNAGKAYLNGGELTDRTLPAPVSLEDVTVENVAEPVEEETAEPVEEETAEPVGEEAAEPVEEAAAEPVEEAAAEPVEEEVVEEEPAGPSYVLSAPVFEPLTAGYRRTELPTAAASLENTGAEPIVVKAARVNGNNANSFTVTYEKNVTIAPGETNDSAWVVSPKPLLQAGEYNARLVLILDSGDLIEAPFSLTIVKP